MIYQKLRKTGNSYVVTIPKDVIERLNLNEGDLLDLTTGVVVVRDVSALVCVKCGDAWIDDPVAAQLETVVAEARREGALVEVTHWQQVA